MTALLGLLAIACLAIGGGAEYLGLFILGMLAVAPIALYRAIARAVDGNSQFTDPKTLDFGPSGLVVAGPNWKSELAWAIFRRLSEDADYFYLYIQQDFPSVLPKSAFNSETERKFRECAMIVKKKD